MAIEQISVFVENKSGKLVEVLETLGGAGIDLRAMSIADTSDFGILRLIADKPDAALSALRDAGYTVTLNQVLPLAIPDVPGSLAKALGALARAGVDVEYVYAFVAHEADKAYVIVRVEDNGVASEALRREGILETSAAEI
jgi:hypothetical protein